VVSAANEARSPVALLISSKTAGATGGLELIRALRSLADHAVVPVCLQLDHATDADLIAASVEAGADSVLADGSRGDENANADFVAAVRARLGARFPELAIEAELGRIEGDEDVAAVTDQVRAGALTRPERVAFFLERSRADLLAVSIGNIHGHYPAEPRLDWSRLTAIRAQTEAPLVLHGASGLPLADLNRAVSQGICKININTELRRTVYEALTVAVPDGSKNGLNMDALRDTWASAVTSRALNTIRSLTPPGEVR
jgi:tagatose 1,6-diphosphate aldolase GatY/KbaY